MLAAGLAPLGLTSSQSRVLLAAWLLLGIGMGAGLYDAALRRTRPHLWRRARARSITGITLIAGFGLHGGMAANRLGAGNHRLAQHLLCLGRGAHPDRPADQPG